MSCPLRIVGKDFDVDAFLAKTKLTPEGKFYRGGPRYKSRPEGEKLERSGLAIMASEADFGDLDKQVEDVIAFLTAHKSQLALIAETPGIEHAWLDFGIHSRIGKDNVSVQVDVFSPELVKLAGELGLAIMLSNYAIEEETPESEPEVAVEKKEKKKKDGKKKKNDKKKK